MADRDLNATSLPAIAARLILLRKAIAGENQAEFCRRYGIDARVWNNYERAVGRINVDNALLLCGKLGVTLDWIYRGQDALLPSYLIDKMRQIEGPARSRRRA